MTLPKEQRETNTDEPFPGKAPIPHQHGAWVMLTAPIVAGIGAAPPTNWAPVICLSVAVIALFLAQHAATLSLRRRSDVAARNWTMIYGLFFLAGAIPLVTRYQRILLLWLGVVVGLSFGIYVRLVRQQRQDRSVLGELFTTGILTLSGPATVLTVTGAFSWLLSATVWVGCWLFFSGGVIYVKTLLETQTRRKTFQASGRWGLVRYLVVAHSLVLLVLLATALWLPREISFPLAAAYLPVVIRAFYVGVTLVPRRLRLKRLGLIEAGLSVWFTAWFWVALRQLAGAS